MRPVLASRRARALQAYISHFEIDNDLRQLHQKDVHGEEQQAWEAKCECCMVSALAAVSVFVAVFAISCESMLDRLLTLLFSECVE